MILQRKPSCLEGSLGAHWPFAEHDGDGPLEPAAASSHWYQDSGTPLGRSQTLWLGPDIQLVGWQDSYHPLSSNNSLAVVGSQTAPNLPQCPFKVLCALDQWRAAPGNPVCGGLPFPLGLQLWDRVWLWRSQCPLRPRLFPQFLQLLCSWRPHTRTQISPLHTAL